VSKVRALFKINSEKKMMGNKNRSDKMVTHHITLMECQPEQMDSLKEESKEDRSERDVSDSKKSKSRLSECIPTISMEKLQEIDDPPVASSFKKLSGYLSNNGDDIYIDKDHLQGHPS